MAIWWTVPALAMALVGVAIFVLHRRSRSIANDQTDLRRHISWAARVLGDRSTAEVRLPGLNGALLLDARVYPDRPKSIALRASAGYLGREAVERLSEYLEATDLEHLRRLTPENALVRDVRVVWKAEEESAAAAAAHALGEFCHLLAVVGVLLFELGEFGLDRGDLLAQFGDELLVVAVFLAQFVGLVARLVEPLAQAVVLLDEQFDLVILGTGEQLLQSLALLLELGAVGLARLLVVARLVQLLLQLLGTRVRVSHALFGKRDLVLQARDLVLELRRLGAVLVVCLS